jgi:uncharacterized protein
MIVDVDGIEVLDESECLDLLARSSIGRVAVTIGAVPAVFPVNFRLMDHSIVFRTGSGTKLDAAVRRAVVAFEVDQVDPMYHEGWSVLVVGMADELTDPDLIERVMRLPLEPWAPGDRPSVVQIRLDFVSGRRIDHRHTVGA